MALKPLTLRIAALVSVVLLASAVVGMCGEAGEAEVKAMRYQAIERRYGPSIRAGDWEAEGLNASCEGGSLRLYTYGEATVTRQECRLPGGGDIELTVTLSLERLGGNGGIAIEFSAVSGAPPGFEVQMSQRRTAVLHNGRVVHEGKPTEKSWHGIHTVRLVTLGEDYALHINGELLTGGRMDPPYTANEGRLRLRIRDADIRLLACEETFIAHDTAFPDWERSELLYEEPFGPQAFAEHWVCTGARPDVMSAGVIFNPMSVCILKERFEGPIAVDCKALPVPTQEFAAGVTDAIFIWMIDKPDGDLFEYMKSLRDANLRHFMPLPFYWVDFGGTNNRTTRLRRNPHRRMIRQFDDRKRLLKRDHTYDITLAQIGQTVEFWVDGKRWIQAHDPAALTQGYIGFRSYVAGLTISDLRVWRLAEK